MKTINLSEGEHTIDELIRLAKTEPVFIRDRDGRDFVLEEADEADREAAALGQSKKFMAFLKSRSAEGDLSAGEVAQSLGLEGDEQARGRGG